VAIESTSRAARFYLALALIELRRAPEAVAELQKILEPRDAETPTYLRALAVAHAQSGNTQEALGRAADARQLAATFGQRELVAAIDQLLDYLKKSKP
jgi:predicted Zn-dependent protease